MSDRIKKLKSDARRLPKNPQQTYDGPRRISHGIIGVRKVRRGSAKSNTSTGSRKNNPFSDLVPTQSRSSSSPRSSRVVVTQRSSGATGKGTERSRTASLATTKKATLQQMLTDSLVATHAKPSNGSLSPQPSTAPQLQKPTEMKTPQADEESTQILTKPSDYKHVPETSTTPTIGTLEDGFVQEDDDEAMESMAMDKIDRFLESLNGASSAMVEPDMPSPLETVESLQARKKPRTKSDAPEQDLQNAFPDKVCRPKLEHSETAQSWVTTVCVDDGQKSSTRSDTRSVRPLSIRRSPTNATIPKSLPSPVVPTCDETFRGVKVSWLLETYEAYMAQKAGRQMSDMADAVGTSTKKTVSSEAKGLRPLMLPAVIMTESNDTSSNSGASAKLEAATRRTPTKKNFTFGTPKISSQGTPKLAPTTPSTTSPTKRISPPSLIRSNTGLTQQDAVEVARAKMNSALQIESEHFIPQVQEAVVTQWQPSTDVPPNQEFGRDSPIRSASAETQTAPALVQDGYFAARDRSLSEDLYHAAPGTISSIQPFTKANKAEERALIVSNNVSFFDPFAAQIADRVPTPTSPAPIRKSPLQRQHTEDETDDTSPTQNTLSRSMEQSQERSGKTIVPAALVAPSQPKMMKITSPEAEPLRSETPKSIGEARKSTPAVQKPVSSDRRNSQSSSDDDLLPRIRPRFNGLGVSDKAQKVLGMSEIVKPSMTQSIREGFSSLSRSNSRKSEKVRQSKIFPNTRPDVPAVPEAFKASTRPTETLMKTIKSASAVAASGDRKTLVEPLSDVDSITELTLRELDSIPKFNTTVSSELKKSTANSGPGQWPLTSPTKAYFDADHSLPTALTDVGRKGSTGLISIKIDQSTMAVEADQLSPTQKSQAERPAVLRQASSYYPVEPLKRDLGKVLTAEVPTNRPTPLTEVSTRRPSSIYGATNHAGTTESTQPWSSQALPSRSSELQAGGVFGNYQISQDKPRELAETDPSRLSPSSKSGATLQRSKPTETRRMSGGQRRVPSTSPETKAPLEQQNNLQNGAKFFAPTATRKISRGRHGRLSIIEQSPQLGHPVRDTSPRALHSPALSIHGLGLGMSPSPTSSNPFDQILQQSEVSPSSARPPATRVTTLDRINKSATPTHATAVLRTGTASEHSVEYIGQLRATSATSDSSVHAVPISYYQPRSEKQNLDPFRNLDMKQMPTKSKSPTPLTGLRKSQDTYSASGNTARVNNETVSNPPRVIKRSSSSNESIPSANRQYVAKSPLLTGADQQMNSGIFSPRTVPTSTMKSKKLARPASMMVANEVHEKFDIRRALARSDDGDSNNHDKDEDYEDEDYEEGSHARRPFENPEDTFGAFATTATQAFSKWFG